MDQRGVDGTWLQPARPPAVEKRQLPIETPVLLFDRVSKWYGPVLGVNQVTLELRGGITGLVGANGAGKTTLLRLATGSCGRTSARVRVLGHDAWGEAGQAPGRLLPRRGRLLRGDVRAAVRPSRWPGCAATMRAEAKRRTDEALELVRMTDRCDRAIAGYSKGMRQRVKMAQALIHDPRLLILDEPLSGIDPVGRQEFVALFRELAAHGKCLLVSSHELDELEKLTDHVAVMARGRIAAVGTLTQIRDLLDDQPLSVRLECDQPRRLAAALMALADVVGVELPEEGGLVVRARNPRKFFQELTTLVLEEGHDVRHVETLDDSAEAILGYLLGGAPAVRDGVRKIDHERSADREQRSPSSRSPPQPVTPSAAERLAVPRLAELAAAGAGAAHGMDLAGAAGARRPLAVLAQTLSFGWGLERWHGGPQWPLDRGLTYEQAFGETYARHVDDRAARVARGGRAERMA